MNAPEMQWIVPAVDDTPAKVTILKDGQLVQSDMTLESMLNMNAQLSIEIRAEVLRRLERESDTIQD